MPQFAFDPTRYPTGPGCYLMRDAACAVLYAGKAKNLTAEALPRLVGYRKNRINKDLERGGTSTPVARYFGPYVNRRFRDALLGFVVDEFQLRTCAPLASQVCLRYHLGACGGVCEQRASALAYA